MKLSIVVLHHNTAKNVEQLLYSLQKADLPNKYEILVLDNGGKNSNKTINKDSYQNLPITFESIANTGFPAGQNYGVSKTTGEYIAVINPDIVLESSTLSTLIAHMERNPQVGVASPELYYADGRIQDNTRKFPSMWSMATRRLFGTTEVAEPFNEGEDYRPIDWSSGALWMIRRSALEQIGGHDERYFLFMSDIGLGREMWSHNFAVHQVRAARAEHGSERLSAGNVLQMLRKKTGRIHIKDACTYFMHYLLKPLPKHSPSKNSTH